MCLCVCKSVSMFIVCISVHLNDKICFLGMVCIKTLYDSKRKQRNLNRYSIEVSAFFCICLKGRPITYDMLYFSELHFFFCHSSGLFVHNPESQFLTCNQFLILINQVK